MAGCGKQEIVTEDVDKNETVVNSSNSETTEVTQEDIDNFKEVLEAKCKSLAYDIQNINFLNSIFHNKTILFYNYSIRVAGD